MTNLKMLQEKIAEAGIKPSFIREKLGISPQGYLNKVKGISEFKVKEVLILCDLLKLSKAEREIIFFE